MEATYKGHQIVVTSRSQPHRVIGRHGSVGKDWMVKIDDQNVTHKVLQLAIKDIGNVVIAAKKYVDRNFL